MEEFSKFLNQLWDTSLDALAKINAWIPLSAVLLAGIGLVAIVLILSVCGCVLRKRLVPNWLIWTYFTFATIIIFAHTGNDLAAVVAAMEIPVLVVLLCYVLRTLFFRRPRYVYVKQEVYAREVAKRKQPVVADVDSEAREVKLNKKVKGEKEVTETIEKVVDAKTEQDEAVREAEKAAQAAEEAKLVRAEQAARIARENEKAALNAELAAREAERVAQEKAEREANRQVKTETVKRIDKNDFYTAKTAGTPMSQATSGATVDMPTVNPIPDKVYEPMREPTIVAKPVSQTIPGLKIGGTNSQIRYSTTTTARPTTSSPASSFNRATTTNTTSYKTTTANNGTAPHSTEDIMAAIARLRASMKK